MHFSILVCSAMEMPEKEKIKKYEDMTKHEIMENLLNGFIMLPPLNSQLRFQMVGNKSSLKARDAFHI